ncbi:MAG: M23 family metallopeptidase [Candidatus Geothermincolia bacterium]
MPQIGSSARSEIRYKRSQTRQARKKRRLIVVLVAGAVILAGIVVGIIALSSGGSGKYTKVPEVEGLTYDQAKARLKGVNLGIEVDPTQEITNLKIGKVKVGYQTPSTGSNAEKGSTVTVALLGVPSKEKDAQGTAQTTPTPPAPEPAPAPAAEPAPAPAPAPAPDSGLSAPLEGRPIYPFTSDASIACGHWESGSQDYPYFGAPRNGGSRTHAGVDIYPPGGEGAPVHAIKDGTVVKIAPFYTRANGEVTYGLLIDHGDFVANYAELRRPPLEVGARVGRNQVIGEVSGTVQLHLEQYAPGTTNWTGGWYGERPSNLLDPTGVMQQLFGM